ncbi:MAG: hypothetical protein EOM02_07170 [Synergistales bacterium]|nr:hypothetical protein [Synergistales bacterium]
MHKKEVISLAIDISSFGRTGEGDPVVQFCLSDGSGLRVKVLNYGGAVREIQCPDKQGRIDNVTLGMDRIEDYQTNRFWAGVICGPVAGRIGEASFLIGDTRYSLSENEPGSCLHGGYRGFSRRIFDWEIEEEDGAEFLRLSTRFDHMEEGFPGPIDFQADYMVRPGGVFEFRWRGRSESPTLLVPTLHLYLNLSGFSSSGLDQAITIDSDQVMLDPAKHSERLIDVRGTRFDLSRPSPPGPGFDNPFLLNHRGTGPDVTLSHVPSGRRLSIDTTERFVVLYDGKGLSPNPYRGIALEPQGWGNGINSGTIEPPVLEPGQVLSGRTLYRFSVMGNI